VRGKALVAVANGGAKRRQGGLVAGRNKLTRRGRDLRIGGWRGAKGERGSNRGRDHERGKGIGEDPPREEGAGRGKGGGEVGSRNGCTGQGS
jgi:hypothetical protein